MANARNGGMAAPEDENGGEPQHEQQTEEDRRRQPMLQDGLAEEPVSADRELLSEPTRPEPSPSPAQLKSDALPSNWQDILAERLTKFSGDERIEYDRQVYNRKGSNHTVSPEYLLELSALIAKRHGQPGYGGDVNETNRRENMRAYYRQDEAPKPAAPHRPKSEQARVPSAGGARPEPTQTPVPSQADGSPKPAPTPQKAPAAIRHEVQRPPQRPAPRKAAPDRTGLVHKQLQRQLDEHAEHRKELNLPPSRAEQAEFARLQRQQEAERKSVLDLHSKEIKLLDLQFPAEQVMVRGKWLTRDLEGSPLATTIEKQVHEASLIMAQAHDRRMELRFNQAHHLGWDGAAATSTYAPPRQAQEGQARQGGSAPVASKPTIAPPTGEDPNLAFKERSAADLTIDRLRAILGRYEEIRETRDLPSGMNESNELARLTDLQNKVREGILTQQNNVNQTLALKHLGERVETSASLLFVRTDQPQYQAQGRRAFALVVLATDRLFAIDPRAHVAEGPLRAAAEEQTRRQTLELEARHGGRTLTAEERASLPASAVSKARDYSARAGDRFTEARPDRGPRPGGNGGNSRSGGGRGR